MKVILPLAACLSLASAVTPKRLFRPPPAPAPQDVAGEAFFDQLLDHDDPSLGTFKQRYWWRDDYWNGPGSPVVLFTPGEEAADGYQGYLTNKTITGLYAQTIGGAAVLLEHRYWGQSSPYQNLSTENLQYLTLKNSIADLTHFAQTVQLPFDKNGSSNAGKAPWVLSGGSYSGALTAWTEATSPGTFWAYHASSAPVESIYDFWQYFAPVQEGMPQNCSKDVSLVIDYVDKILMNGTDQMKTKLKTLFGLQDLTHDSDFGGAIEQAPWLWQENAFYTGYSQFYQFCDAVENVSNGTTNGTLPGAEGVGLRKALNGYASWFRTQLLPGFCASTYPKYYSGKFDTACFNTYNASSPIYTDWSVDNDVDRQWTWMLCNEPFGWWQDGAPTSRPSIVSRTVTADYQQRECLLNFPTEGNYTFGSNKGRTEADENAYDGGWDPRNTTRLTWTNGQFDPWRSASTSSDFRPDGPLQGTPAQPVNVIPSGIHCSDLILENADVNAGVQKVVDTEVAQIKAWVAEFYNSTSS